MNDRRRFKRVALNRPVSYSDGKHLHHGIVENISNSGVFILTRNGLASGTSLVLCLELPKTKALLQGTVVRDNPFGMGVRFKDMDLLSHIATELA